MVATLVNVRGVRAAVKIALPTKNITWDAEFLIPRVGNRKLPLRNNWRLQNSPPKNETRGGIQEIVQEDFPSHAYAEVYNPSALDRAALIRTRTETWSHHCWNMSRLKPPFQKPEKLLDWQKRLLEYSWFQPLTKAIVLADHYAWQERR